MLDVLQQKIVDSLATPVPQYTRRDVRLPKVAGRPPRVEYVPSLDVRQNGPPTP